MKQKIITSFFFIAEIACSFFAWKSLYQAVLITDSSRFLAPSIFFSFLAILLLLSLLFFVIPLFRVIVIAIVVLPVFFFGWSLTSLLAIFFAGIFLYWGLSVIDRELSEHVTVRFFASARTGTFLLSIGLSIVIVATYSVLIAKMPTEKLLPRFSLADGAGQWVLRIAGTVNPALSRLGKDDLSVDEFIIDMMPKEVVDGEINRSILPPQNILETGYIERDFQKNLFLTETKRRISGILSRDVAGDERATNVLSEIINAKIFGTIAGVQKEGDSVDMLRAIIALLLFLSLVSLGSFFGFLWAFFASVFFWLLQGAHIVTIHRVPIEMEQIVLVD